MLEDVLSKLFALIDDHLVSLLVLDNLEVHGDVGEHIFQHHVCEVVSIVVHHAAAHLGQHPNLAGVRAQIAPVSGTGDVNVTLSLLHFLKHRLQLH